MKRFFAFCLYILMLCADVTRAEETITLLEFTDANPICLSKEIFYDGCNIVLCSDGEYLFVQFNVLHPEIQMRLLMQGLTVYVDPTGKNREKYAVVFPSAKDVQDKMQPMPQPEDGDVIDTARPDLWPLLDALNEYGAIMDVKGKRVAIGKDLYAVWLNEENEMLSFTVIVPLGEILIEKKLSDNWCVGLYSQKRSTEYAAPTDRKMEPRGNGTMELFQIDGSHDLRSLLMKDVDEWTSFTFSYICTLND